MTRRRTNGLPVSCEVQSCQPRQSVSNSKYIKGVPKVSSDNGGREDADVQNARKEAICSSARATSLSGRCTLNDATRVVNECSEWCRGRESRDPASGKRKRGREEEFYGETEHSPLPSRPDPYSHCTVLIKRGRAQGPFLGSALATLLGAVETEWKLTREPNANVFGMMRIVPETQQTITIILQFGLLSRCQGVMQIKSPPPHP